jgi:hypothetical protein
MSADLISEQMATAVELPTPESAQEKIDALKASETEEKPVPVTVGYVQTEEETTGEQVMM